MKEEKKRWVMPKFLPHKYDVKLISEDKVGVLSTALKCFIVHFRAIKCRFYVTGSCSLVTQWGGGDGSEQEGAS